MSGVRVVVAAHGHLELRLCGECRLLRERLGITAWVALEALVLTGEVDGRGGVTVAASARDLALRLGIGRDRAATALAVLRDAGLVVQLETRAGPSARFVEHRYEVRVLVSRVPDMSRPAGSAGRADELRRVARDGPRLFDVES